MQVVTCCGSGEECFQLAKRDCTLQKIIDTMEYLYKGRQMMVLL
ncbi:hypothetical protein L798_01966 [Zootermopsis nevadensis]|uniref:Uncharacterized protein n=1 Tax=Zootermopsis nevadensis TaxID=136037 RepID=A0A067QIA1_ZOONE|nr:hypothetical protein L798_01966 [Zootermopsis nevadensis]